MQRNVIKELIKPRRVELDESSADYGKFVIEPLERGYGTTLGNSLRRILLSSLPGAAITSARIDGVKHEFSTIPGCIEDVTEIVLNLKQVVVDIKDKDHAELRLEVRGKGDVRAGAIGGDPAVRIVNPDLHIASLNEDGSLVIELTARVGRGYVVSELNKEESAPLGTIALDALFSPVKKVNFVVSGARVGQRTDYDKLTLEIWTNGSLSAEDALQGAAYILRDQLGVFVGTEDVAQEPEKKVTEEHKPRFNENLFRRIDELELSVRSANCLENSDIKYIGELVQRSEAEMLRTKNFGRKSLSEIKEILGEMNLNLGMKLEGFPARDMLERMTESSSSASN
ncbi:MAG: DNA-directed RNA polymerase subunit alpha [Deltaproteobacteria bacterium]|nr:DNA-directed RNA polymerase subunit alpha [Deltaproteobacteria bacterium]